MKGRKTVENQGEPGSFRDRHGRVQYRAGEVLRTLDEQAFAEWRKLSKTGFFSRFLEQGKIVPTSELPAHEALEFGDRWKGLLRHQRVPFVSYPYEWPFGMLRAAALLHLELTLAALEEGMILKDATSFNIQWIGSRPTFIDIPSFETMPAGGAWTGYRQFCQLFLYPLFLQSYKNLDFHPWLRGALDGIEPSQCSRFFSWRERLKPGVFSHVYLQSKLQRRYSDWRVDVRKEMKRAGFSREMIRSNLNGLQKLVTRLEWRRSDSTWSGYAANNSYSEADHAAKMGFVRQALSERRRELVWDLGCNTGVFSEVAAEQAGYVVAMDADHSSVDLFYRRLEDGGGSPKILPLVNNLADPSPALGWRHLERKNLVERGKPDFILCLALIHHLVIAANIPLQELIAWLASLAGALAIEFVSKEDPMVKKLLANKEDQYDDYRLELFEEWLARSFVVRRKLALASGTRFLYHCDPKGKGV